MFFYLQNYWHVWRNRSQEFHGQRAKSENPPLFTPELRSGNSKIGGVFVSIPGTTLQIRETRKGDKISPIQAPFAPNPGLIHEFRVKSGEFTCSYFQMTDI